MRRCVAATLVVSLLVVVQSSIDPTINTETRTLCASEFIWVYNYLVGKYIIIMISLNDQAWAPPDQSF